MFDPLDQSWHGQLSASGSATLLDIGSRDLSFVDFDFDVNSDNRFNQLDQQAIVALIGTADPNIIARWDFDNDGAVDSDDASYLQLLIDLGLDSGVFGDLDADGQADCTQILANISDYFASSLGDPGYRVELDYDLNGINDLVDQLALMTQLCPSGNMNCDAFLNAEDIEPFIQSLVDPISYQANYPGCDRLNADIDQSGFVDVNDVPAFVSILVGIG